MNITKVYEENKSIEHNHSNSFRYKSDQIKIDKIPTHKSNIQVVFNDTLSVAEKVVAQGGNVCVLNFANSYKVSENNPGFTQEGDLILRSNLEQALPAELYPGPDEVTWTPKVTVFRKSERREYKIIDPFEISVITCKAISNPKTHYIDLDDPNTDGGDLEKTDYYNDNDKITMQAKTDLIMKTVAATDCDTLLVGAWGCGMQGNPEYGLCQLWKKSIARYPIKHIIFPIWGEEGKIKCFKYQLFKKFL